MSERTMILTGRVLTGIFALFMLAASIAPKFLGAKAATDTLIQLGWPGDAALMIGMVELFCLILYLTPRTSLLGAVLMTGLLGGAMATQVRVGNPLFSHILFSLYLGLFMWGGLWLRYPALRRLFPVMADSHTLAD
jgi:DoxX-like family